MGGGGYLEGLLKVLFPDSHFCLPSFSQNTNIPVAAFFMKIRRRSWIKNVHENYYFNFSFAAFCSSNSSCFLLNSSLSSAAYFWTSLNSSSSLCLYFTSSVFEARSISIPANFSFVSANSAVNLEMSVSPSELCSV